ncbi:MAG: CRISPR-associated helicase Cas3' [Archaeoglobaceae archaeon]|nr:CRISPR-associated helicase Cas3' [Archaeoglobaceae archaeon]
MMLAKLECLGNEKYFQTLLGHAIDSLKIFRAYLERKKEILEQFCNRWKLDKNLFLKNLFITIYLHDIGKLTEEFQQNISKGKYSQKYPHAYFGFYLLNEHFRGNIGKIVDNLEIELASILGHHTTLYDQIYSDENLFEKPTYCKAEIHDFIYKIPEIYKKLNFSEFFEFPEVENLFDGYQVPNFSWKGIKNARKRLIEEFNSLINLRNTNPDKIKSIYSYFFSILKTCDDYSSLGFSEFVERYEGSKRCFEDVIQNPENFVNSLEIDDPTSSVLGNLKPHDFQEEAMKKGKFVILFAPCGRGKTEAALMWALNVLKRYKRDRIVFAMPTQTTSNAMFERLAKIFGRENVGLYHGMSFIKIRETIEKGLETDDEVDIEDLKSDNFKGNIFFKPITVTTVDHIIFSFVKGFKQADFAVGNIQNAVIIFDEVHYYEKLTLEHIMTLLEHLKKMDIPHLLMSGTLPKFVLEKLSGYDFVVDSEGLQLKPFKIFLTGDIIFNEKTFEEVIDNYKNCLNQFVVLNTVGRAKKFYKELEKRLPNGNIVLYHSQFTYEDRIKKEEEIYAGVRTKPFILVATQVIEISLDISCDIMYTELAPPDALGQRGGRLNRKGLNWRNGIEHSMKIFLPENHNPYTKELIEKTKVRILDFEKPISYQDIKEFCDSVYEDYNLNIPSEFDYFFRKNVVFGDHWKNLATENEEGVYFKVREEKIQYVDVIPEKIIQKIGEKAYSVEHMAKVPLYILLSDQKSNKGGFCCLEKQKGRQKKFFWICRYPYNYRTGFEFEEEIPELDIIY